MAGPVAKAVRVATLPSRPYHAQQHVPQFNGSIPILFRGQSIMLQLCEYDKDTLLLDYRIDL